MKIRKVLTAVTMTVVFLCSNVLISKADFSNEYAKDDYRRQPVIDIYGEEVAKPIANFRIIRMRNGEIKDMLESYYDNDLSAEFPSMQCYVGDTIVFEDLSKAKNNANIKTWDFQYYGMLGDSYNEYNYNILESSKFELTEPGETAFFLCVKSDVNVQSGSLDPWSENGNHQTIGINKWFPKGMYWYFASAKIVVNPAPEAIVNIRYWDVPSNRIFHEEQRDLGEMTDNEIIKTTVHINDWDGYEYNGWNVQLADGEIQYTGDERDVDIELAPWVPIKNLNIEYYPKEEITPPPTDSGENDDIKPSGICDGEIEWTENATHRVVTGYNSKGNAVYSNCKHTFTYKATLSANATVSPSTFKSGYGFETKVNYSITTKLIDNAGEYCSNWNNNRSASKKVKEPTKTAVYIPWSMTNRLGTQSKSISMDKSGKVFQLPKSPVSESGERKIYTDVSLAGTQEKPVNHSFEIYISGGGVGNVEYCKKITKTITINGDMFEDDFSGAD